MLNDAANGRQIWLLKTLQDPWFHFQYPPTKMNLPMPFKTIPCGIGPVHFHVCFRKVIRFDFQVVCMERSLIAARFGGPSTREVSSRLQAGTRLRVVGFGECVDRLDAGGGGRWRSKTPRIAIHKTHAGPRFVSTRVTPASTKHSLNLVDANLEHASVLMDDFFPLHSPSNTKNNLVCSFMPAVWSGPCLRV